MVKAIKLTFFLLYFIIFNFNLKQIYNGNFKKS